MKIYTKTGDDGETGLFGGPRVRKDNARIESFGEVDELNAVLGIARTESLGEIIDALLGRIQSQLFDLGAQLASPQPDRMGTQRITAAHVAALETAIDRHESGLPPLTAFILPGGTRGAALLHFGRTVCRRAERRLVTLMDSEQIASDCLIYLNRLSDLLFVLARAVNHSAGREDVLWPSK